MSDDAPAVSDPVILIEEPAGEPKEEQSPFSPLLELLRSNHHPTHSATALSLSTSLVPHVAETETELTNVSTRLTELQTELGSLTERKKLLERRKAEFHSMSAPIRSLPPEILLKVFRFVCLRKDTPITLSCEISVPVHQIGSVCAYWRNLAYNSAPELWSFISLDASSWLSGGRNRRTPESCATLLTEILEKTGTDYPLDIILKDEKYCREDSNATLRCFAPICPYSPRFRSLDVHTCSWILREEDSPLLAFKGNLGNLEFLSVKTCDSMGSDIKVEIFSELPKVKELVLCELAPEQIVLPLPENSAVRDLTLNGVTGSALFGFLSPSSPSSSSSPTTSEESSPSPPASLLTSLSISSASLSSWWPPTSLTLPLIESFSISDDGDGESNKLFMCLSLPSLTHLSLEGFGENSYFSIPALEMFLKRSGGPMVKELEIEDTHISSFEELFSILPHLKRFSLEDDTTTNSPFSTPSSLLRRMTVIDGTPTSDVLLRHLEFLNLKLSTDDGLRFDDRGFLRMVRSRDERLREYVVNLPFEEAPPPAPPPAQAQQQADADADAGQQGQGQPAQAQEI